MKHSRNPAEDSQQDVDEEVRIAASLQEDAERREEYGGDDLDDVAGEVSTVTTSRWTDLAVKGMVAKVQVLIECC